MICPFCKYEHDNEGDRYGCPNCHGEGLKKPKSRAADMKKVRQRRKDSGLVEFRCWCTPEEKQAIELALNDIRAVKGYGPVIDAIK
jgi:hypothetical protein